MNFLLQLLKHTSDITHDQHNVTDPYLPVSFLDITNCTINFNFINTLELVTKDDLYSVLQ
jgi:hypothetical protein